MKTTRWMFCGFLLACTGYVSSSHGAVERENDNSPLSFIQTEVRRNEANEGQVVNYIFKYKNTSLLDLWITKVTASCSCSVGEYSHEKIEPDMNGSIRVYFNTSGLTGEERKTIMVFYRDSTGSQYSKELTMIVNVATSGKIIPSPRVVSLEGYLRGATKTVTIDLARNGDTTNTQITKIEAPTFIECKYTSTSLSTWRMECQVNIPDEVGEINGKIIAHTSHSHFSKVIIPVLGYIEDEVRAHPRHLVARYSRKSMQPAAIVISRLDGGRDISIENYEFSGKQPNLIEIVSSEEMENGSWRIFAAPKLVSKESLGLIRAKLVITLVAKGESFQVPVNIMFIVDDF